MTRLRLGLAGGLIPADARDLTPERAQHLVDLGVRAIVAHFFQNPPETIPGALARKVRTVLADAGLHLSQVTGYNPNLVHPDDGLREKDLARLRQALHAAAALGADMVISGCGSLHPSFFYGPAAGNHRPETRERLIGNLRRAAAWAAEEGVALAMECHVLTTLDTPENIRAVLDAVDSPWLVANFDPVNLIGDLPALYANDRATLHAWHTGGPRWSRRSMHLKDILPQPAFVMHLDEVAPGSGLLDYATVFSICRQLDEGAAVIVEHLEDAQVPDALRWVKTAAEQHGLSFM
jgi:sugar phosphate isomerase/epimerase